MCETTKKFFLLFKVVFVDVAKITGKVAENMHSLFWTHGRREDELAYFNEWSKKRSFQMEWFSVLKQSVHFRSLSECFFIMMNSSLWFFVYAESAFVCVCSTSNSFSSYPSNFKKTIQLAHSRLFIYLPLTCAQLSVSQPHISDHSLKQFFFVAVCRVWLRWWGSKWYC